MRQTQSTSSSCGFTLIDVVIAMAISLVVLSGALVLTSQATGISDHVTQQSDMQQNGRVAINLVARELSSAGTGFPAGGIQLPSGSNSVDPLFACDSGNCFVNPNNAFPQDRLFAVTPGNGRGPTINGVSTDVVTLVFSDPSSDLDQEALTNINVAGTPITFDTGMTPPYNDPVSGVVVGDVLVLSNSNGQAAAVVTGVDTNGVVHLAEGDPLQFNQPNAGFGKVLSILNPAPPGHPPTYAYRVSVITYYIDDSGASPQLMRQVNAQSPVAVAEDVENLQITYDVFDENTSNATADLPDANSAPNQIRKVNISLTTRTPVQGLLGRDYQRVNLTTSVGPRNLTYRDRYQ